VISVVDADTSGWTPISRRRSSVTLANKMARIACAILRGKTIYREIPA
jgi:hypothetical protein